MLLTRAISKGLAVPWGGCWPQALSYSCWVLDSAFRDVFAARKFSVVFSYCLNCSMLIFLLRNL